LLCFLVSLLIGPRLGAAFEVKQAGQLKVPPGVGLFAFSTDPIIQEVLSQDFNAAARGPDSANGTTVTVSVNVTQEMLKPGVSLSTVAPGDPQAADLMKAAGANPPPLGDTGNQFDEAAFARRMASRDYMPNDTQSSRLINSVANPGEYSSGFGPPIPIPCSAQTSARPGCPPVPLASPAATPTKSVGDVQQYLARKEQTEGWFAARRDNDYDTVVVARVSVSGQQEEMTLVAISHPGEDIDDAKKHVAERIANSILR
jgi:hypothetical protein